MITRKLSSLISITLCIIIFFSGCSTGDISDTEEKILLNKNSYTMIETPCYRDNIKIYGVSIIPKVHDEKIPVVIMSHGYLLNHIYMLEFVPQLVKAGIACYCFDFSGGSVKNKSEGAFKDMSPLTEVDDLNCVIDKVKQFDYVDTNNIYLLGHSQGGLVSAYVAARRPEEIKSIFLFAPAFIFSNENDLSKELYTTKFREDSKKIKLFDDFTAYKKPVYIYHGDKDYTVPVSYSQRASSAYDNCTFNEYKYQKHDFTISRKKQITKDIAAIILESK